MSFLFPATDIQFIGDDRDGTEDFVHAMAVLYPTMLPLPPGDS